MNEQSERSNRRIRGIWNAWMLCFRPSNNDISLESGIELADIPWFCNSGPQESSSCTNRLTEVYKKRIVLSRSTSEKLDECWEIGKNALIRRHTLPRRATVSQNSTESINRSKSFVVSRCTSAATRESRMSSVKQAQIFNSSSVHGIGTKARGPADEKRSSNQSGNTYAATDSLVKRDFACSSSSRTCLSS
eukprot:IDg20030t1